MLVMFSGSKDTANVIKRRSQLNFEWLKELIVAKSVSARRDILEPWMKLCQRMCALLPQGGLASFYQAWCLDVTFGGCTNAVDQSFPCADEEPQIRFPTQYRAAK
jgi:hypothetical protein